MAGQGVKYTVDIVMCIDSTGSMGSLINTVKASALRFHDDLLRKLAEKDKNVDLLRVKVISFRDYYHDGDKAMAVSPFFELPKDTSSFNSFVEPLIADGGGDEPENGLEALALAIKSDWAKAGDKRRQIIIVWTDASAHKLELNDSSKPSNYPSDLPKNFDEITDWWEGQSYMNGSAKRLILFAPDAYPWTDIATYWSNAPQYPSKAGAGLSEVDYSTILDTLVNSV
ncbi:hypothetical protein FACS1894142_0620 [Spirochaetia bacterium]|nr:hypothetical protein FACS1894142_0620 [Spirochaetia bacterium]